MKCSNCKSELQTDHAFCPKCGFDLRIKKTEISNKVASSEVIPDFKEDPELLPPPIVNSEQEQTLTTAYKETYSSGIKTTFIWSSVLSIITVLLYFLKGRADTDVIAQNLIQGIIGRPLVVFFFAFIISFFFQKKTEKFNSVCTWVIAILTIGELARWIVIIGA